MTTERRPLMIVITGDEEHMADESRQFIEIIQDRFDLSVYGIDCRHTDPRQFRLELNRILGENATRPVLVVYNGHGGLESWAPWSAGKFRHRFPYRALAALALRHPGQLLFLNSTCFAKELAEEFMRQEVPADRVGVIAACEAGWMSVGHLLLECVLRSWLAKKPYRPGYMGETYFVPDTKKKQGIRVVGIDRDCCVLCNLGRLWYGFRSLFHPLHHTTYFSKRWGAELDEQFFRCLKPAPSYEERGIALLMRYLPSIQIYLELIVQKITPR